MDLSMLLLASFAWAEDGSKEPYDHLVSLTFSPLHLALPVLEVTGEVRVHDRVGVAALLGVGSASGYGLWEVGAQGRAYPLGDFDHGLQLGAEVGYLSLAGADEGIALVGRGWWLGPFVGYKIAARFGLTFEAQLGPQWVFGRAAASGEGVSTTTTSAAEIGPLLNLNLGWSF